jgi:hypothetical protein
MRRFVFNPTVSAVRHVAWYLSYRMGTGPRDPGAPSPGS